MNCKTHDKHEHMHKDGCGHAAVKHEGHVDYLHDGHLHHPHEGHTDEHSLAGTAGCTQGHDCAGHDKAHRHGPSCGHASVPHGSHTDYLVAGHLHCLHEQHCDRNDALAAV